MNEIADKLAITIGISACLTGQPVRFDKGHKHSDFCMNELGRHVEYQSFCPEVAIGLPVPRPTIRQVRHGDVIKVCQQDGSGDVFTPLQEYGNQIAAQLANFSGFIFCAKSPSCGIERIKVYHEDGNGADHNGIGVFAQAIMHHYPNLPIEDSGRLNDPGLKENFVLRVFTYHKWLNLMANGMSKHKLIDFHSQHKYLVMSHDPVAYKAIGKLLGESTLTIDELAQEYINQLMQALKKIATRKSHTNTLQHLQGYFKRDLDTEKKRELTERIEEYRQGLVPLLVPLTLINHYLREHPNRYVAAQIYLSPYPSDLRLRYAL